MSYQGTWRLGALGALGMLATAAGCAALVGLDAPDPGTKESTGSKGPMAMCMTGAPSCDFATDCGEVQTTDCILTSCDNGCCGTTNSPMGTNCTDNGGNVCDGNGACIGCMTAPTARTPGPRARPSRATRRSA